MSSVTIELEAEPPRRKTITFRNPESTPLRELLATVDLHQQHGGKPIAKVRKGNGDMVAWVEKYSSGEVLAGDAPDATDACWAGGGEAARTKAINRGVLIATARDNWQGVGKRTLKPGAQSLLDQYGD